MTITVLFLLLVASTVTRSLGKGMLIIVTVYIGHTFTVTNSYEHIAAHFEYPAPQTEPHRVSNDLYKYQRMI
jgi:hypothetical protein